MSEAIYRCCWWDDGQVRSQEGSLESSRALAATAKGDIEAWVEVAEWRRLTAAEAGAE